MGVDSEMKASSFRKWNKDCRGLTEVKIGREIGEFVNDATDE